MNAIKKLKFSDEIEITKDLWFHDFEWKPSDRNFTLTGSFDVQDDGTVSWLTIYLDSDVLNIQGNGLDLIKGSLELRFNADFTVDESREFEKQLKDILKSLKLEVK